MLDVDDLSAAEVADVLDRAKADDRINTLEGRGVALYFQKPSARTRHSAELAVVHLSGHPVTVLDHEVGIDTRGERPRIWLESSVATTPSSVHASSIMASWSGWQRCRRCRS